MKRLLLLLSFLSLSFIASAQHHYAGFSLNGFLPAGELKKDSPSIWGAGASVQGAYNINNSPVFVGGILDFVRYGSEVRDGWHGQILGDIRHRRHNELSRLLGFVRVSPDCDTNFFPYVDFMAGMNYIYTRSILRENWIRNAFDSYVEWDDFSFTYGLGFGVEFPLDDHLLLDFNFRTLKSSRTEYLTPSSVNYDPNAEAYNIEVRQSRFDSFSFGFGLKVYLD